MAVATLDDERIVQRAFVVHHQFEDRFRVDIRRTVVWNMRVLSVRVTRPLGGWAQAPRDTHRHRAGSSALAPCGARRAAARALPRALPAPSRPMLRLLSTPAWERPSPSAHLQPAWATDRRLL